MKITDLKRNQLRYLMFRLRTGQADKASKLTSKQARDLLKGWGIEASAKKAGVFIGDLKDHYESQLYFTGWDNFAAEVTVKKTGAVRGTNKSWDIGMIDGDGSPESQIKNIARMVNRPHKWFLYGTYFTEAVSTRGLVNGVTEGLNYYERQELLADKTTPTLRDQRLYPDTSGKRREFNYRAIYTKGLNNGTNH